MKDNIIDIINLDKKYEMGDTGVLALKNINLKINKGEFIAIVGPSGSGKSTLMNLIGCLDIPTKGDIFLDGQDISKLSESDLSRIRGKKIGFIFQQFNLYPTLTTKENIELPMRIHNFKESDIREKSMKLIRLVSLEHRSEHLPSRLSGGERQRAAIARALSTDPMMILADEPTGNIDSKTGKEIMSFLTKLNVEKNVTIVIVTHDAVTASYANRIVEIKDGQITRDDFKKYRGDKK